MIGESPYRIMLTARDVGAAGHILTITKSLKKSGLCVLPVMQALAGDYFRERDEAYQPAQEWYDGGIVDHDHMVEHMIEQVAQAMQSFAPDLVITGQSTASEIGIDELSLLAAKKLQIPVATFQDFWGEVHTVCSQTADCFFLLDETALSITRQKTKAPLYVIGSLKHLEFLEKDFHQTRRDVRSKNGIPMHQPTVGFFGQDLLNIKGYSNVIGDLANACKNIDGANVVFRPHPREREEVIRRTLQIFEGQGVTPTLLKGGPIEDAIVSVDAVVSCFSTVGADALQIARLPRAPVAGVVYAHYPASIREYWQAACKIDTLPFVSQGLTEIATDRNSLTKAVGDVLKDQYKLDLRKKIHAIMPDPCLSEIVIKNTVLKAFYDLR